MMGACEWLNPAWFVEPPLFPPLDEVHKRFPRIDTRYKSIITPHYPETSEASFARSGKNACALANAYEGDILIVGHGHSVLGMARGLMRSDCSISAGLCALVKIIRQNGATNLELNGDSSHLSSGDKSRDRFN